MYSTKSVTMLPSPTRIPGIGTNGGKSVSSAESAAWHRLYLTPEWTDDLRPGQLLREPYCRECARHGVRTRATDVDHIQPHKGDWQRFTDRSNLQSLCHSCHSRKTLAEMRQK